ncbi:MAG TPA: ATP-binding cassette domain-containing protein [Rhodoferax sp.]|jgi:branched-chain amino acid transport system ATP-binding protein|nr:ATP-binding cassette domain-containing protein [Rhodoferax sp.]HNV60003.1 ATP-binding cassette domain-containing protein [Rhodoferax sp.]HPW29958.1 ATP-binding cassette domain-containing protein [Rhodoferax sp.]
MLEIRDLRAWYGQAQALFGVSLTVGLGELVVLQGLNGAGKSTLLQAIVGIGPRVEGVVRYQSESMLELPSHQRALRGLGYVPEDRRLFTALTVRENLLIAARRGSASALAQRQEQVLQLFPALKGMLGRSAAHMSGGEQQMLAIARTLMAGPSLLLLDEPCEGISPVLVESIRDALLSLKAQGIAMLVAEQNGVLTARADRVITLTAQTPLDA